MKQQAFDFNRAVRLRWLDRMVWRGAGAAPRSPWKALLRALEGYDRGRGEAWPSVAELARNLGVSTRTVQRALRVLEGAGLVSVEDRTRWNGSDSSRLYRIAWGVVLDWVPAEALGRSGATPPAPPCKGGEAAPLRGAGNCHPPPVKLSPVGRQTVTLTLSNCHPLNHTTISSHTKPTNRNHMGNGDREEMDGGKAESDAAPRLYWGRLDPLTAEDLRDGAVVRELWSYARLQRWVGGGEAKRLRFFALCLYCARVADDPGKMLTANCRNGRWYGSADDEAAARRMIEGEGVAARV